MRQYVDPEVLNYAVMMVKEQVEIMAINWQFKDRSIERIARIAIDAEKIENGKWLQEEIKKAHKFEFERYLTHIAKRDGYYPFIQFRKRTYKAFEELYGADAFTIMQEKLQDPTKIGTGWAAQFIGAVDRIGREVCRDQDNLFEFVTSHQAFSEAKEERARFLRHSSVPAKA